MFLYNTVSFFVRCLRLHCYLLKKENENMKILIFAMMLYLSLKLSLKCISYNYQNLPVT